MTPLPQLDLADHHTLGVASRAEFGSIVSSEPALLACLAWADQRGLPVTVLGAGSNVIPAATVPGLVVLLRSRGIKRHIDGESVVLDIQAGENWHQLVRYTLGQGLAGLESLALIPGNVGAAPIQNIGAYGSELSQTLVSVRAYDRKLQQLIELPAAECGFGYRTSRFKTERLAAAQGPRYIVLSVALRLQSARSADPEAPRYADVTEELLAMGASRIWPVTVAEAVCRIRRRKLPDVGRVGNVGSVFKNPVVDAMHAQRLQERWPQLKSFAVADGLRLAAAQLIDLAGWKGRRLGSASVWPRQPLVLIQHRYEPRADSADFQALLAAIQADVRARYGIELEVEPQHLG